jgi:hypothetical protein
MVDEEVEQTDRDTDAIRAWRTKVPRVAYTHPRRQSGQHPAPDVPFPFRGQRAHHRPQHSTPDQIGGRIAVRRTAPSTAADSVLRDALVGHPGGRNPRPAGGAVGNAKLMQEGHSSGKPAPELAVLRHPTTENSPSDMQRLFGDRLGGGLVAAVTLGRRPSSRRVRA